MAALQLKRLKKVVKIAWTRLPYYRAKMEAAGVKPSDIQTLADVQHLPFTTKDDLRGCFPYNGFAAPLEKVVRIHASSGTTGQATVVGYTRRDIASWRELMARLHTAAGITSSDIVQIAFGYGFFTGGLGHHYGIENVGAAVLPVSSGKSERQIQIMKDYGTTVLICTPSYAMHLAEIMAKTPDRERIRLRLGLFGGEAWTEALRMADMALYVAKRGGRDAWAAIWGTATSHDHVELRDVRADPERALAMEWVAIGGNRPMNWSGAAKGADRDHAGSSHVGDAMQGRKTA